MADWKQIPDTDVDPDAPVTSELMYALRDNPVALAEGAEGAPRVMHTAINAVVQFGITAQNYVITNLRSRFLLVGGTCKVAGNGAGINVFIEFSSNGGSSWFGTLMIGRIDSIATAVSTSPINAIVGNPNTSINAVRLRWAVTGSGGSQHGYDLFVASIGSLIS